MLCFRFSLTRFLKSLNRVIFVSCLIFSNATDAATAPSAANMLVNFTEAVPSLMRLVTALAYVMGFFFIIKGLLDLKQFGESRSMMSQEHSLTKPIMVIVVGTLLLYLPASVQTGLSTFWTSPNPYGYLPSSDDSWNNLTSAVFMVVQLVGVISFIKGVLMLRHVAGHGQPDTFAKAVTHIIAGILCINLYQFLQAVFNTLGISGFLVP